MSLRDWSIFQNSRTALCLARRDQITSSPVSLRHTRETREIQNVFLLSHNIVVSIFPYMPAPAAVDQDLFNSDFRCDPRDWQAVRLLCDELEAEMAENRRHLLRRLCDYLTLLAVFRSVESRKMVQSTPGLRDKEFHRAILSFLLGSGEMLLLDLKEHTQIDPINVGVDFHDFAATIQQLRYDMRLHHGDMTTARRASILNDVFPES